MVDFEFASSLPGSDVGEVKGAEQLFGLCRIIDTFIDKVKIVW